MVGVPVCEHRFYGVVVVTDFAEDLARALSDVGSAAMLELTC